jgi:hypothetical protein
VSNKVGKLFNEIVSADAVIKLRMLLEEKLMALLQLKMS